jgi:DNA mismatch repair protein MutS
VVSDARRTLSMLEQRGNESHEMSPMQLDQPQQMGLFVAPSPAVAALAAVDPDELTPKQALEALYRLRAML